jgi:hypothetical protein
MPYIRFPMHSVILTPDFIADAAGAGLSDDEVNAIVAAIANDPMAGDLRRETGGARKRRFAAKGKGKSGGIRVVTYYAGDDIPIFLLTIIDKSERDNLSKAERNALRKELSHLAEDYRGGQRARAAEAKRKPKR